jgi:hypothetical protein
MKRTSNGVSIRRVYRHVKAIGLPGTVQAAEQFPGVPSAATPRRTGSTAKWSRQLTKISPRAPVRIMGAGHAAWIGNDRSASHRQSWRLAGFRGGMGVSQSQSRRGGQKGCPPLCTYIPVDTATAHLQNGIASEEHAGKGGAKRRGRPYGGKFMRLRKCWKRATEHRDYSNFAYSALASFRMGMSGSASCQRARKSW